MRIALIHEVFPDFATAPEKLNALLAEAVAGGAEVALLPEIPLDRWAPASREIRDEDAEPADGPRHRRFASASAQAGIALVGGAIVRDADGTRRNTALVYDRDGGLLGSYDKVHIPHEEGFWEADHYAAGCEPPEVVSGLPMAFGLQICSDVQRGSGCEMLAAAGAEWVFVPRCTPAGSYERWKLVLRSRAVSGAAYVVSVNRPRPEGGVEIGGPGVVIAPDGEVLLETTDPVSVIDLDAAAVETARADYPGYLARPASLYVRGWSEID